MLAKGISNPQTHFWDKRGRWLILTRSFHGLFICFPVTAHGKETNSPGSLDGVWLILIHCLSPSSYRLMNRAWDLLRRIFVEKPEIKGEFRSDIISWVMDDSKTASSGATMEIDIVEKEVLEFKNRMEVDGAKAANGDEPNSGWKKWQGEWTPRPIGVL
jgi:hypothetical protein